MAVSGAPGFWKPAGSKLVVFMHLLFHSICFCAAAGLAGGAAQAQSYAALAGMDQDISVSSALQELAPAQPHAVTQISIDPPEPLPEPLPFDGTGEIDAPGTGNSMLPPPEAILQIDPAYSRNLSSSALRAGAGKTGIRPQAAGTSRQVSVMGAGKTDTWTLGTDNWRYSRSDGTNLVLGNDWSNGSVLDDKARLGGVALTQSSLGGAKEGSWQYSVRIGALDYSGDPGKPGGLTYGPRAGEGVLQYGVSRQLSLETQTQWASGLSVGGIGGKYATQNWGAWQLAVAKASRNLNDGWRYRVGYQADVLDSLSLGWVHDESSNGFSDLASYRDVALDAGRNRHQWSATLKLGRWGDLNGSFEQISSATGYVKRQFGLTQQFWYSPNLRVSLKAERELISGDYDVGVNFAVPVF